jgi:hypothetical protein
VLWAPVMLVENALIPTGDQLRLLADDPRTEPIVMLNLLKFRAHAVYADGRDAHLTGNTRAMVVGAVGETWDTVALVEYPSPRAFLEIAMSPEVHGFAVHREAGLEGQLLLMLEPR